VISIQRERYSERICAELLPLVRANWAESPSCEPGLEVDPDFERYRKLDEADILLCFTAREGEELIGYVIYVVSTSRRHRTVLCGYGEAFYIKPDYRGHGPQLLRAAHQALIARGVRRLGWLVDEESTLARLLLKCEFHRDEIMLEKKLS
jgi:GNAT superfamily N-acetyltransferase